MQRAENTEKQSHKPLKACITCSDFTIVKFFFIIKPNGQNFNCGNSVYGISSLINSFSLSTEKPTTYD